jgi:hypothetical protein
MRELPTSKGPTFLGFGPLFTWLATVVASASLLTALSAVPARLLGIEMPPTAP